MPPASNASDYERAFAALEKKDFKKEFFEFKNKFRRIMPVITESSRKKLLFKINLVKSKRKLIYPGRDFVHIKDFLSITFKILKRKFQNNKTFLFLLLGM